MKFISSIFLFLLLHVSFPSMSQRQDLQNARRNLKNGNEFWAVYYVSKALTSKDIKKKELVNAIELLNKYLEPGFEQGTQIYESELVKLHKSSLNQAAKQYTKALTWNNNLVDLSWNLNKIPKLRLAPNEESLNATISSIKEQIQINSKMILEIRFDLSNKFLSSSQKLSVHNNIDSLKLSIYHYFNALEFDEAKINDSSELLLTIGGKIKEIDDKYLMHQYAHYINRIDKTNSHVNLTFATLSLKHWEYNHKANAQFIDSYYEREEELSAWTLFNYGRYLYEIPADDKFKIKGIKILEEAATKDNQYAYYLADLYSKKDPPPGWGGSYLQKYDPKKARYWATLATLNNKDGNQVPLITGLATGDGVDKNISKALDLVMIEMKKLNEEDIGSDEFNDLLYIFVKLCPYEGKCLIDGKNISDTYKEYTHCKNCDGTGRVKCHNCDGVGYFERYGDDVNCNICGSNISRGSGYLNCPVRINSPSPFVVEAMNSLN